MENIELKNRLAKIYELVKRGGTDGEKSAAKKALEALLRDAPETYLGDVIKPLKNILGAVYGHLEEMFEEQIVEKFSLSYMKLKNIKQYDKLALEFEHKAYIKDKLGALVAIRFLLEKEIGGTYQQHELPVIFMKLVERYSHDR